MAKIYRLILFICFSVSLQSFGQGITNPILINSFPHTETGVNSDAGGVTGIGMQGTCNAIPCCSLYVYKVTLPANGVLRVEMTGFTPLGASMIAYRSLVSTPTSFSDLQYVSATAGNFCGFRDTLQLGRGYTGWKNTPLGSTPTPSGINALYDFDAPSPLAGFFPAGDYYILFFNENQQFNIGVGTLSDITFEFAEACSPLTTPSSLTFDTIEQNTGKDTIGFYIKNDRQLDVVIDTSKLVLSGTNNSMFSVVDYPDTNLTVGDSTRMSVVFNPTLGGTKMASLEIQFSDTVCSTSSTINLSGVGAEADMIVSGNGTNISNNDITPSINNNTNFGALVSNTGSISKSFTILNQGTDTLTLSGSPLISLVGSTSFSVTSNPSASILPGASTSFSIQYTPTSIGIDTVEVTIANNDAAKGNYQFRVIGTGAGLNGLNFDGSGDYVNINTVSAGMAGVTSFTVETWIKVPPGQAGNDAIVGVNTSSNGTRMLLWIDDGILEFHVGSSSKVITSQDIRDDAWHNLVFVVDNGTLDFYLDGVPTSTITNNVPSFSATDKWSIGQEYDNGGASDFLLGSLDEFRLWKTARTHKEILDARYCEISNPSTDLLAYYTFNQGVPDGNNTSLSSLTDWSGSGFDGTLNGFSLNGTSSNFIATSNVGTNCTSFSPAVCDASSYTSPSGKTYTTSGLFKDTITNSTGGDSLLYIDLRLNYTAYTLDSLMDITLCVGNTLSNGLTTNYVSTMNYELSDGDWAELDEVADSLVNTNRSIFMWMKAAGQVSGTQQVLVGINTSGTSTVTNFGIATNEQLWINDGGSNRNSGVTVTDGNWHFVGYTYDEGSNLTTFYVDGVAAATFTNGQSISATSRISIGQEFDGSTPSNFFDGDITEVSFWNEVLDVNDISVIMKAAIEDSHVKYNNLIAYYSSNASCSDDVTMLRDFSGNNLHGVFSSTNILNKDSLISINGFDASSHFDFSLKTGNTTVSSVNPFKFVVPSTGAYTAQLTRDFFEINDPFTIGLGSSCVSLLMANAVVDSNVTCNGGSNGGASASTTGGTSPYTYLWNNSATTASITGVAAGTYSVTITDNASATATTSVTITEPVVLVAASVVDSNASCNGSVDGGATASATGGTAPYTYAWSNSATTASIAGVSAGTYTVTVTDNKGCTSTSSATITQPTSIVASVTVNNNASIAGASDGQLTASGTGGTNPYTYAWSNSGTTASITGLVAGTYTVTITDANGCTANSSGQVLDGATALSISTVVDSNVSCNGGTDGGATASTTGGASPYTYLWSNSAITASITGVTAGTYTVKVKDNSGDSATTSVTITEPVVLVAASVVDSNVSCNGGADGGATASATGGTAPYTYAWSNSATTASTVGVSAGTYTVTVTDNKGCTSISSATITQPTSIVASVTVNNNTSTAGASDGQLTASVAGGTNPYTYAWSNSGTTASITGLVVGTYTVTITDANGCIANSNGQVLDGAATLSISAIVDSNVSCNGGTNGGATASTTGGASPYTYLWSNSATTASITGVAAGTYTVKVKDNSGDSATTSVSITEPAALNASTVVDANVSCNGGTDGGATASATGGTSPYTYAWNNGATTASITGIIAGIYTVTITDANSCTTSSSATLTQPAILVATVNIDKNASSSTINDGQASASATGGTAPYTYLWNNSATTANIVGLAAGTYSVTITDAKGCTDTASGKILTEPAMVTSVITDNNVSCNGGADGAATVSVSGGAAPYTYAWSNMATTATASGLLAGKYTVTVTDTIGRTAMDSVTITEPQALVSSSGSLISNVIIPGNWGGWQNLVSRVENNPSSFVFSGILSSEEHRAWTKFDISSIDDNAVVDSVILELTQNAGASTSFVNININDVTGKIGPYLDRDSLAYVDFGNGTYTTIQVSSPGVYSNINLGTQAAIDLQNRLVDGEFQIALENGTNEWKRFTSNLNTITVYFSTTPDISSEICYGDIPAPFNSLDTISGGTGTIDYIWQTSADFGNTWYLASGKNDSIFYEPTTALFDTTFYRRVAIDANCADSLFSVVKVYVADSLQFGLDAYDVSCNGAMDGFIKVYPIGGVAPYTYMWNNSATTDSISGLITGTYTVTVTDKVGCVAIDSIRITEPTLLSTTAVADSNVSCHGFADAGASVSVTGGTSPYTYAWSNSGTTASIAGVSAGTYIVTITDANGCTIMDSVTITEPNLLTAGINLTSNESCVGISDGGLSASPTGGTMPYSYLWSNGNTTSAITGLSAGTYLLTITDANGCAATDSLDVILLDTILPIVYTKNINVYLDINGTASITASDIDSASFDACGIDTMIASVYDFNCSDLGSNTVTLYVTDNSGNKDSATTVVTVLDTVKANLITQNVSVYLNAAGSASITVADINNGSTDACGIQSTSLNQTTFNCGDLGSNTVWLKVTDINGNVDSASATVSVLDTIYPIAVAKNTSFYLNASGTVSITGSDLDNGSSDNCTFTLTTDISNFDCSDIGLNLITLTATDAAGNSHSTTSLVTIRDSIRPTAVSQNVTIQLGADGKAIITPQMINNGSSDNCNFNLSVNKTNFDCGDLGSNTVILTATDNEGLNHSTTAIVTVEDNIAPTVLTQNISVQLNAMGIATILPADVNAGSFDNCGSVSLSLSQDTFRCANLGVNAVVLTVDDGNGQAITSNVLVTVEDLVAPVAIARNITTYLDASGNAEVTPSQVDNASTDNCSVANRSISQTDFDCSETGSNNITLTVTDAGGNTSTATATVTVLDTIAPQITGCPADISVSTNAGVCSALVNWTAPTVSDNCTGTILTSSHASGNLFPIGSTTVMYTSVDASGNTNSCSFTITVTDNEAPVVNCPADMIVSSDAGNCDAVVNYTIGASDNCTQNITITQLSGIASGGVFPIGNTVNQYVAVDSLGNSDTCSFTITVQDNEAPSISCPSDTSIVNDVAQCGAIYTYTVPFNDNCTGSTITQTAGIGSGNLFPAGSTINTFIVTDAAGNSNTCSFTVTVNDTSAPSFVSVPTNITVYSDATNCNVTATWSAPTATDNCTTNPSISISHNAGSIFLKGTTTVSITATDVSGNMSATTFDVTVVDTVAPVFANVPTMFTITPNATTCDALVSWLEPTVIDNCSAISLVKSHTSGSIFNVGTTTVTYTATDVDGNTSTVSFDVVVNDVINPVFTSVPTNLVVGNDAGNCDALVNYTAPTATDNCGTVAINNSHLSGTVFPVGITTVSLTATDNAGNVSTSSFTVTVNDTSAPSFVSVPANITVYSDAANCDVTATWSAPIATDNCTTNSSISISHNAGSIFPKGTTTVSITATDVSGNMSATTFDVTVVDTVSPVFANAPTVFTVIPSATTCDAQVSWLEPTVIDNCSAISLVKSHTPGSIFSVGTTTVTYTATDVDGNISSVSFDVVVNDVINPVFTSVPTNITVSNDAGSCDALVNYAAPTATDNCGTVTISNSHPSGTVFPVGITTVSLTATDNAGNVSTDNFTVTVNDAEAPVVTVVPASDTVGICGAAYVFALPTATDNCSAVTVSQQAGLPSGSIFPIGTTVNVFTLKDVSGNQTQVSFQITVLQQEFPDLVFPGSICENGDPVDLVFNQVDLSFSGKGVINNGTVFSPPNAGQGNHTITYNYTDVNGCSTSGTFNILVLAAPSKPIISQIAATTLGTGAYATYQWFKDGAPIAGANQQTYEFSQQGNYQVSVSNLQACEGYSEGWAIGQVGGGIGIEENKALSLNLFPNPTQNVLNIQLPENAREDLVLNIYSSTGALVISQQFSKVENEIIQVDMSGLSNAFYNVMLLHNGKRLGSEIIILDK